MYRDSYQRGLLTIFFSCGSKPLKIWDTCTRNGYITKFLDEDIKSTVLEIGGTNVSTTYMICPKGKQVLGITMPFLVMIVKNLKKYFSFEVTILDDTGTRRRFRVSNFQSTTQILPLCTVMPIALSDGWNQIQFNMSDFCRRAYQKQFVEVQKCKINANIRVRRIYFADRIYEEDKLPSEYKLFIPMKKKSTKDKPKTDEVIMEKLEKVPSTELKKDSKTAPQVQEEKRSSKVLEKPASVIAIKTASVVTAGEGAPDQTMATEESVAVGEETVAAGEETVAAGEETVAAGEETVAAGEETVAAGEETVAAGEETVAAGEETVAVDGETVAAVEGGSVQADVATTDPVATAEEPVAEAEAPAATGETSVTEDAATEATEPVKEKSVENATQHDPVSVEDKATDAAKVEEKTPSAGRLETIEEKE